MKTPTNDNKQLQTKVNDYQPNNFLQLPQLCIVGNEKHNIPHDKKYKIIITLNF